MRQGLEVGDIVTFESEHDGFPPGTPFAVTLTPLTAEQREQFAEWERTARGRVAVMQKELEA